MRISAQANHRFRFKLTTRFGASTETRCGGAASDQEGRWHFRGIHAQDPRDSPSAPAGGIPARPPCLSLPHPAIWQTQQDGRLDTQRLAGTVQLRSAGLGQCGSGWNLRMLAHALVAIGGDRQMDPHTFTRISGQEWRDDGLAHAQRWPTACVARLDLGQPSSMCP